MDYHNSPQFTELLSAVIKSYEAQLGRPLEFEQKSDIEQKIRASLERNTIEMKFMSQMAKINVILKSGAELSPADNLAIAACAMQLEELKRIHPTHAAQATLNATTILNLANPEIARRQQVMDIMREVEEAFPFRRITAVNSKLVSGAELVAARAAESAAPSSVSSSISVLTDSRLSSDTVVAARKPSETLALTAETLGPGSLSSDILASARRIVSGTKDMFVPIDTDSPQSMQIKGVKPGKSRSPGI